MVALLGADNRTDTEPKRDETTELQPTSGAEDAPDALDFNLPEQP